MDEAAVARYITETFAGVAVVEVSGDQFYFYDPTGDSPDDRRMPFATLVTGDRHDTASRLDRPAVFRLNIGVSSATYRSLFGPQPSQPGASGIVDTGYDFAELDRLLPHPVYAPMSWVCVLNPSDATFETVRPLLAEAYERSVKSYAARRSRA